ncbi:putative glycine rich protein [Helianthus annuus]|uniref:Glycine rich protein n=1 Tax=Helianthus annuus TaxID=4232 RepID=A0A251RXH8_HELAN|nr:putative glycine rich protein [Helianthus annuus]KAJ0437153.1 putative glycine rich protein [Helianthus annuus]KAJ0459462.1 putative glycine rich protein [Helianthus annuus]
MVSKRFLFIVVAFAIVLITSEIAAAKELTTKHESEVKDAKHGGYYNGGRHGGHHHHHHGHRGGYCKYGCCGNGGYYSRGCRCCHTLAEATAYKQAHN